MIYSLALTLAQQPEALERVLRVTRHRAFKVTDLGMQLKANDITKLNMIVESDRPSELLSRQLDKIVDVIECSIVSTKDLTPTKEHINA